MNENDIKLNPLHLKLILFLILILTYVSIDTINPININKVPIARFIFFNFYRVKNEKIKS
jgi:hypothetical protein